MARLDDKRAELNLAMAEVATLMSRATALIEGLDERIAQAVADALAERALTLQIDAVEATIAVVRAEAARLDRALDAVGGA